MLPTASVPRRAFAMLAAALLSAHGPAMASERIFLHEDERAGIHLSDQPQNAESRLLIDGAPLAPVAPHAPLDDARDVSPAPARRTAVAHRLDRFVEDAAIAQSLDPNLVHAVIATESAYAPRAVSPRGALGLMQLMPATARSYGVTDAFDVRQNLRAGTLHLRRLLDRFDQDTSLALAAYNAGAGAVMRNGRRIPPFAETTHYVQRVLVRYAALRSRAAHLPFAKSSS